MFFEANRRQFFAPLTSKYRAQVVECLKLLYARLYSANADYGQALQRAQLVEIFEEAIIQAPLLSGGLSGELSGELAGEDDEQGIEAHSPERFRSTREQANWVLKVLLDAGWIEKRVDTATLQSSYPFSQMGRLFTQPMVELGNNRIRTRHRNTRNTLNALEAFISRGDTFDLLDAYDYSERIITDFTDVIAELEDRKRQLAQEVESQILVQQATDQFFEFMEKRFQPDVSVRLSADSVEKHRDQIASVVQKIRRKPREDKQHIERQLRRQVPELVDSLAKPEQSVLWFLLDTIEQRMRNAADIMLPALRHSLHSFTKRADIIIRQLSYLHSQQSSDILDVCQRLAALPKEQGDTLLDQASGTLANFQLGLIDPSHIKLSQRQGRRVVKTAVSQEIQVDREAQKDSFIQQLLDQAFVIDNASVKDYVKRALRKGQQIDSSDLPIDSAADLLALAHVVELGAVNNLSSDYRFVVTPKGTQGSNDYFQVFDEFTLALVEAPNEDGQEQKSSQTHSQEIYSGDHQSELSLNSAASDNGK